MDQPDNVDVVIIGAGAAGLAAARDLRAAEKSFVVLEARGRVGGRIYTYRDRAATVPIELGAEFLHGQTPETDGILDEAGLTAVEVVGEHWRAEHGHFSNASDFWESIDSVLGKLDEKRNPDRSFSQFLEERAAHTTKKRAKQARARRLALEFVQGFHAADPDLVSERWLAVGGDPGEDPDEERMGRVLEGYDRVTAWLAGDLFDAIELNTVVERVDWEPGRVSVTTRGSDQSTRRFDAQAVIVTVPVGVLKASRPDPGAIAFEPEINDVRVALTGVTMGTVVRTVFAFTERFWEHGLRRAPKARGLTSLSFIHSPGSAFPVWWTLFPLRTPVLVGWTGGPPAADLAAFPEEEIERRALRDLARHIGTTYERLAGLVRGSWSHNWLRDPFSRGAYSYAVVGGSGAARTLAKPVADTIFFAGEATDTEGRTGTVEGALATGRRAARGVLQIIA